MEDSYTVHRRRKAAARKREKTPEAPRRGQDDVTAATDDDEDARARMERMVQETERLEELEEIARQKAELEKTAERADRNIVEKPQRALKRAMSPEIRRKDEEVRAIDENFEPEATVQVLTLGVRSASEKTSKESKDSRGGTKKASDVGPEMRTDSTKEFGVDVTRKSKKEEIEVAPVTGESSRTSEHRSEVKKDFPPEIVEKPVRSIKKAMSPEVEKPEKNRADVTHDEWTKDAGNSSRTRKTSSRISDKETEDDATALDKNRYEASASVATRESEAGTAKTSSGGKSENVKNHEGRDTEGDARYSRSREASEKTSRNVDESVRIRKRDVTSPSKVRNSESRVAATTKRTSKDRNVEKTGYTTDSSDTEENAKRILRRKKSPEGAKTRSSSSRKTPSRSRVTTDTDGDVEEHENGKRTEKRSGSRRRRSSDTDEDRRESAPRAAPRQVEKSRSGEKRSSARALEDDRRTAVRKSGTFPVDPPRDRSPAIGRSVSDVKKQIIPLSDDSLIEDFERAQQEYLKKERGILDHDPLDDYIDPRMEAALRRRKFSIVQTQVETKEIEEKLIPPEKKSWFGWIPFFGKRSKQNKTPDNDETKTEIKEQEPSKKSVEEKTEKSLQAPKENSPRRVSILEFFRTLADFLSEFRAFVEQNPRETRNIRIMRNRCMAELLLAIIYCGLGAFVFRFTEGAFETFYKCGVKRVKRDFLDTLWNFSHNMREEDWKSMARRKLMEFEEQLHTAHEAGVHSYSGQKSWSFLNAVVYCLTVITTIGYGHISPSTTTGRAITIVYAIFGIPMFLIILADFGKLFTRGIKFLWAFVRRVYYTGSCRRVRRTAPVQEVMKGVQLVYDFATFRRPSQMNPEEIQEMQKQQNQTQTVLNLDGNAPPGTVPPDTPGTPALSTFAIDDEFNLPISVAIFILLVYIFVGATVYNFWEEWGFFESFYFVFISMSTIGFGDYVPKHPIYMMLSIVYLVFGLALTSMCINVVQVMLSDSFKQASQKIGATIGFEVAEDDGSEEPAETDAVELADVHATIKESESKEQVAPKAKQEDVEL